MYKRTAFRCVLVLVAPAIIGASYTEEQVNYTLSPVIVDGDLNALAVEVRFRANENGNTTFAWQGSWQGDESLFRWASNVQISGATNVESLPQGRWRIDSAPSTEITVRYQVRSAYDAAPTSADVEQTRPVILGDWFYTAGEVLFGRPDGSEQVRATFEWRPENSELRFASDLEHLNFDQSGTVADVLESIVIGGRDLDVRWSADRTFRIATTGQFGFERQQLTETAEVVASAQRNFWGGFPEDRFLITAIPLRAVAAQTTFGGTGRGDAFALWIDENAELNQIKWLIAHENFHTWLPRLIGVRPPSSEASARMFWFTEGFTDYFARALLVRSGAWTPKQFQEDWNAALIEYAASSLRRSPGDEIASLFRSDPQAQRQAYLRGALLAARWNAQLREQSGGKFNLDDIIRQQLVAARTSSLDPVQLFRQISKQSRLYVDPDIDRYISGGQEILLEKGVFGPCASVDSALLPAFDRGFDADATATANNVISGVDPTSPAFAAGLRNGMMITGIESGSPGNSMVEYGLRVRDKDQERVISYMPQGSSRISVQQVVLVRDGGDCPVSLGGR